MLDTAKNALIEFRAPKFDVLRAIIDAPGITIDSGSYGGWESVSRPQEKAINNWTGLPLMTLTVPILFDELHQNHSVEGRCKVLEQLAGRQTETPPPIVTVKAASDAHKSLIPRSSTMKWAITGLEWGDSLRRKGDGQRVRQAATVTLQEHVDPSATIRSASRRAGNSRRHTTHIVKKGESLVKVSILEYGTADRWQDIAKANKIHDPRNLKPGTKLKLPK